MKLYGIPALVLGLLLALCLGNSAWLSHRCEGWQAQLDRTDTLVRQESWEAAERSMEALYGDWQSVQTWLHITIDHEELDEAEALFCRALVLAEEEDSVEFRAHIADLHSQLQLLAEMEQVRLENVL